MEVWEKVNYLIEEKKMSKREFADKLVALTPKLKRTDESPSVQTILGYLYGKSDLSTLFGTNNLQFPQAKKPAKES